MRKDGKYLIYLSKALCEDSMFPFKVKNLAEGEQSIQLKASFKMGVNKLIIEPLEQGEAP